MIIIKTMRHLRMTVLRLNVLTLVSCMVFKQRDYSGSLELSWAYRMTLTTAKNLSINGSINMVKLENGLMLKRFKQLLTVMWQCLLVNEEGYPKLHLIRLKKQHMP